MTGAHRMILALDVDYRGNEAMVAGLAFEDWSDANESAQYVCRVDEVQEYVPGQFYRRELPCLLALLHKFELQPEIIVIDGFVFLDGESRAGLGKYLYDALGGKVTVIGVAKTSFAGIGEAYALRRGDSIKPLYITVAGDTVAVAREAIAAMHGQFRVPTLLKKVDHLCRTAPACC